MQTVRKASELFPDERMVIERLLGRPLADDEMFGLSAPVLDPSPESHEHSGSRSRQLREHLDRMASRTVDASDDHIDNAIDTTLAEVRKTRR